MKLFVRALIVFCVIGLAGLGWVWSRAGSYGLHVLFRRGGTYWVRVNRDSPRISAAMRVALDKHSPAATAGEFHWRSIDKGFEVSELPVLVDGREVDRILLARIDPERFRFVVRNSPAGDKNLDQWMAGLPQAALVVNGSYYARGGKPDTPFLSGGVQLGPTDYDAKAGAFVSSGSYTGIRDLSHEDWKTAFRGAEDAMVSYPLLVANGETRVMKPSEWLSNRSFVGQDAAGHIIIGTTKDAYFTLESLAHFLRDSSLGLTLALNLDGGPVASQGISLNGYDRRFKGRWEVEADSERVMLLTWPYGTWALPVVLAVFPK